MKRRERVERTADGVMLDVLAYEFDDGDRAAAAGKIRRRLRYHGLGPYRPERVALLRRLVAAVRADVEQPARSRYYCAGGGRYAAPTDFDVPRLVRDVAAAFPDVAAADVAGFVPFAIYLYYLR